MPARPRPPTASSDPHEILQAQRCITRRPLTAPGPRVRCANRGPRIRGRRRKPPLPPPNGDRGGGSVCSPSRPFRPPQEDRQEPLPQGNLAAVEHRTGAHRRLIAASRALDQGAVFAVVPFAALAAGASEARTPPKSPRYSRQGVSVANWRANSTNVIGRSLARLALAHTPAGSVCRVCHWRTYERY